MKIIIKIIYLYLFCGPGSSVGIATGYELDGPEIESSLGRDFSHLCRRTLRPIQHPVPRVSGLSLGVESGRSLTLTPHPLLMPRSKTEWSHTFTLPEGLRGL
jgi:hypothetical protein